MQLYVLELAFVCPFWLEWLVLKLSSKALSRVALLRFVQLVLAGLQYFKVLLALVR